MQDRVTLDGCIQDSKERQNKAKKKAIGNESSRKSHRKHLGDMAKHPPTATDCFLTVTM